MRLFLIIQWVYTLMTAESYNSALIPNNSELSLLCASESGIVLSTQSQTQAQTPETPYKGEARGSFIEDHNPTFNHAI